MCKLNLLLPDKNSCWSCYHKITLRKPLKERGREITSEFFKKIHEAVNLNPRFQNRHNQKWNSRSIFVLGIVLS